MVELRHDIPKQDSIPAAGQPPMLAPEGTLPGVFATCLLLVLRSYDYGIVFQSTKHIAPLATR